MKRPLDQKFAERLRDLIEKKGFNARPVSKPISKPLRALECCFVDNRG